MFRKKKINLLLLGASGGVSNAFLHHLTQYRHLFDNLILLDKSSAVLNDPYINYEQLKYHFIHHNLELPQEEAHYRALLKKYNIDIVLDLTDSPTIPLLEITNKAGCSYINTALNDESLTVTKLVQNIYPRKHKLNKAPHILCSGMNPGVVNMWVRYGIEKFGTPNQVVHFEYDTSTPSDKWASMMTWSLKEFVVEAVRDPSGIALGRDNVKELLPNALMNRVDMQELLSPIMKLESYPKGMQVLHEENVTIAQKYNIPSQFIYAVNTKTMDHLTKVYLKKHDVEESDLLLGDNTDIPLDGSDSIGVILDYKDKLVYYFNPAPNISAIGTNGTYTQVIVGVYAALFTLMFGNVKRKTYFVEDLYDTLFKHFMFDNMRVSEYVFSKGISLSLKHFTPSVKLRTHKKLNHLYL